jgi:hypothetical protein
MMAGSTTKILKYDLDAELLAYLTEIEAGRGTFPSLAGRFTDQETKMQASIDRIKKLENGEGINTEFGDFDEKYEFDANGNVIKHTIKNTTAVVLQTTDYVYADAVNGILNYSEKKFTNAEAKAVTVRKTYTYDAATGNITDVATRTTVV